MASAFRAIRIERTEDNQGIVSFHLPLAGESEEDVHVQFDLGITKGLMGANEPKSKSFDEVRFEKQTVQSVHAQTAIGNADRERKHREFKDFVAMESVSTPRRPIEQVRESADTKDMLEQDIVRGAERLRSQDGAKPSRQ